MNGAEAFSSVSKLNYNSAPGPEHTIDSYITRDEDPLSCMRNFRFFQVTEDLAARMHVYLFWKRDGRIIDRSNHLVLSLC